MNKKKKINFWLLCSTTKACVAANLLPFLTINPVKWAQHHQHTRIDCQFTSFFFHHCNSCGKLKKQMHARKRDRFTSQSGRKIQFFFFFFYVFVIRCFFFSFSFFVIIFGVRTWTNVCADCYCQIVKKSDVSFDLLRTVYSLRSIPLEHSLSPFHTHSDFPRSCSSFWRLIFHFSKIDNFNSWSFLNKITKSLSHPPKKLNKTIELKEMPH